MKKALEGIKVVEVGGAAAMPLAGMLLGSWGAEIIHVERPGIGDMSRDLLGQGTDGWTNPHHIKYVWEHTSRNKKSIAINLASAEGQDICHKLIATADIFSNNLRPYEMEKFRLSYSVVSKINPQIIYANLTGYGQRGPERNVGGYDSVAFWARSGIMDLLREGDGPPPFSRPGYGDSTTAISLLAGIMAALYIRERTGLTQEVEVSLYNTAIWALGIDIADCLTTGKESIRPQRRNISNPLRNLYPTSDNRWIMLGMTNAQHYWPRFCKAIERPELERDPRFATLEERVERAAELITIIEEIFRTKTYSEWTKILSRRKLLWSPIQTTLKVTKDEQALANDFFVDWDHPKYGRTKVLNNPIKLSKTPAEIKSEAPDLGKHTDEILVGLGYSENSISKMKKIGIIG